MNAARAWVLAIWARRFEFAPRFQATAQALGEGATAAEAVDAVTSDATVRASTDRTRTDYDGRRVTLAQLPWGESRE